MAKPTTYSWSKFSVWPGDGASPEDFTKQWCGITEGRFAITVGSREFNIPDCDDPDAVIYTERVPQTSSATASGSGLMSNESWTFWKAWSVAPTIKNVRIVLEKSPTSYFEAPFILSNIEWSASEADGKIAFSFEMVSAGTITNTVGAP